MNMGKALDEMAERRSRQARENQQFAMTSANNLALLLSEALEQMQKTCPIWIVILAQKCATSQTQAAKA